VLGTKIKKVSLTAAPQEAAKAGNHQDTPGMSNPKDLQVRQASSYSHWTSMPGVCVLWWG